MTNYREILRLHAAGFSQQNIAYSCGASKKTVNKVVNRADELNIHWPLDINQTDAVLAKLLFEKEDAATSGKKMPDFNYIRKELLKNGVSKKLLWNEYVEECHMFGEDPFMYSQFCYHIQQDEAKRRASMHIPHKPAEQVEVDWAGDPAHITDPETGEVINAYIFVGVLSYSQYAYAEAFFDEKQSSWTKAHVNMFSFFGGVPKIIVPDNCKTAVVHTGKWNEQQINATYHELAEHYGTAIIPARVRRPQDKPNAEASVRGISTWIIAALRNEQFFSLKDLNRAIKEKLKEYNDKPFQKKEGSRSELFRDEEQPFLASLPATPYELAEWKSATVLFNYHISVDGMLYSCPYEYIKKKVDVRVTDSAVEIFYDHDRIASHARLKGRKGQYSTIVEHMPKNHQEYISWNGDRFRNWAKKIGENTYKVVDAILSSKRVEQQTYRSCMGLLKLAEKHSPKQLEEACKKGLTYTSSPSYKSISNILAATKVSEPEDTETGKSDANHYGITRGSAYYRRNQND